MALITGALLAAGVPLRAHHSVSSVFEMTRRISVTGTLTKIDWINPHVLVVMEGKADDGAVRQWTFESNPPLWYQREGFTRADFAKAVGQTITIEALPAKNRAGYGYMQKMRLLDGTTLNLFTAPGSRK